MKGSPAWDQLHPGMGMPLAMGLLGAPDDSFQIDTDLVIWTFRTGGWVCFMADRVMDWGRPLG